MASVSYTTGGTQSAYYGYYADGTSTSNAPFIPRLTFASERDLYDKLADEVKMMLGNLPKDSRKEIESAITQEVTNLVSSVMVPVESPLGITFRMRQDGLSIMLKALEGIVARILAGIINEKLEQRAIELKKYAEGRKPSNPTGQSTPIAPSTRSNEEDLMRWAEARRVAEENREPRYGQAIWTTTNHIRM